MSQPTVFISYSQKDRDEKDRLLAHLGILKRAGLIDLWSDDRVAAGGDWKQEINQAMARARVAILLITANYLNSNFVLGQELPTLLKRRQSEGLIVLPVIAKACAWQTIDWLKQMNVRPENHRPVWSDAGSHIDEDLAFIATEVAANIRKAQERAVHLFISYKRGAKADETLAIFLSKHLTGRGHTIFIDQTLRTGVAWLEEIDRQLKASDFLVVLLSKESADSEMIQAEIRRAHEYRKSQGHPQTLPVRMDYEGLLPYSIDVYLNPLQYVLWHTATDNKRVAEDILAAIEGQLPPHPAIKPSSTQPKKIISEDGRPVTDDKSLYPPLPEFDPRFLDELEAPGGVVRLRDKLYVKREADTHLEREIVKWGTTTTIRAPRQMGKTSLLMRGVHKARQSGAKVVSLDFQTFGHDQFGSYDIFLRELAELICHELRLDVAELEKSWQGSLGTPNKLTYFLEDHVLPAFPGPLVLAMDEADNLLEFPFYQDFFSLVRAWHNRRARYPKWEKFNIVLVISTEPYLLIDDINQSPFNVGLKLELSDFTERQVRDLNHRHGSPISPSDFPELMNLLNGHPYLVRKSLYTLVIDRLTWQDLTRVAANDHGPFGDHLRRHHWGLRNQPELKDALKQIIRANRCSDETSLFRLLRAGLIKANGDICTCRCELYRRYFEDKLS